MNGVSLLGGGEAAPYVPPRLLIAEDEPVTRSILGELASSWGYDTVVVEDGHHTLAELERDDAPRLALLDWMMPGIDGVEVCRTVRAKTGAPYTYIIVLTALNELDRMIEAMDAGADDFLGKPFQPHELEVRLRAGRRIVELQEELIRAREALRELATIDALTRTWNRRAILDVLDKELGRRGRMPEERGPGVLIADLDHFKRVNDTFGHLSGDQVLRETARRIRGALRRHDEVGRYGGEEFLVVVDVGDEQALARVGERLRRAVGCRPIEVGGDQLHVTISVGGVVAAEDSDDAMGLIERADRAMYQAKRDGRDRVVIAAAAGSEG